MRNVRHMLLALLAIAGLLVGFVPVSARLAAPAPTAIPMDMAGGSGCDYHSAPVRHGAQNCAITCCAVLPSLPPIAPQTRIAIAPAIGLIHALSGIDLGLDPPPPRAA